MYRLIYFVGLLVRQFLLPNPFETMWPDKAFFLNWICGIILCPVSYFMTGLVYQRGDGAVVGSILFNGIYMGLTFLICGAILLLQVISENMIVSLIILSVIIMLALGIVFLLWLKSRNKKEACRE